MSDLLHTALNRHAALQSAQDGSPPSLASLSLGSPPLGSDLIPVQTPAGSIAGSPTSSASSSRASSPSRKGRSGKGGGRPPRDKTAERAKAAAAKGDPLVRFGPTLAARIFALLSVGDLVRCQRVNKKWRRSQTINYTWYRVMRSTLDVYGNETSPPLLDEAGALTWPRDDSLVDWAQKYAEEHKPEEQDDESESDGEERDDEGLTKRERHEQKWAEEDDDRGDGTNGMTKEEARRYYKSLGNAKVKGKYGKGGERTHAVELGPMDFGAVDPI